MNPRPAALATPWLVLAHLLPGAIATLLFILLVGPVQAAGYPPLAAFLIAIGLVIIPFELGAVFVAGWRAEPNKGLLAAIPYRRPMRWRDWLILVPGLLIAGIIGFGIVAILEGPLRTALSGWLPSWFVAPVPLESVADYSRASWIVTLIAYFALNVVLGPVAEELYFRGYLLPRMSQFGRWAPLVNVTLFSMYHFWSPWQFLSRVAGVTPYAYAVWRKENVHLGIVVHALLNAISVATVTAIVLGRL